MCIQLGVSLVHSGTGSTSFLQIRFFTTVKCLFIFVIWSVPSAAPRPSWELWIVCWKILVHYNTKKQCQEFIGNMMVGHFWASVCVDWARWIPSTYSSSFSSGYIWLLQQKICARWSLTVQVIFVLNILKNSFSYTL